MKRKLQIGCGFLSPILLIEVSTYAVQNPPSFLHAFLNRITADAGGSTAGLTCVSTDPDLDVTPPPPSPPPPVPPPSPPPSPSPDPFVPLTETVMPSLDLTKGQGGSITYTLTNSTTTKIYIAHINVVNLSTTKTCNSDCLQVVPFSSANPVGYHDPTERLIPAGSSYTWTATLLPGTEIPGTASNTSPVLSDIKASVYWELNMNALGKTEYTNDHLFYVTDPP